MNQEYLRTNTVTTLNRLQVFIPLHSRSRRRRQDRFGRLNAPATMLYYHSNVPSTWCLGSSLDLEPLLDLPIPLLASIL